MDFGKDILPIIVILLFINECLSLSGGFYADNGRQQSILLRPLRRKDKQELEHEILHLLGLHHRPNPKQHHDVHSSAPQYLIDLYKTLETDDNKKHLKKTQRALAEADFIVSFVNKIHEQYPHIRHEKDKRFWFDTSQVPADEEIFNAEFRFYRNFSKKTSSRKMKYLISLFAVTDGEVPSSNTLELVDEMTVNHQSGWLSFNVTGALVKWIAFPKKNLGLYMKIRTLDSSSRSMDPHEIGIASSTGLEEYQPFMVAYFKTSNHLRIRTKRASRKHKQESYYDDNYHHPYGYITREKYSSKRNCQRSTLYVSFKDLGWEDWIIAPDGYGAFYCEGECSFPLNANMNATNHAIVQTLVHLMDPSVVPKPQCSPTQLTAITVLYFDNNSNVILKKYRNMVVKSCGCH